LGAERGPDAIELDHARRRFVLECRAAGIEPVDAPYTFADAEGAAREASYARRLGYRCKSLVRPEHVAPIRNALTPSADEIDRAPIGPELPRAVAESVALHRAIDSATDRHPDTHALKAEFAPGYRRFAGLALDLYFDHCLARHWPRYADEPLDSFVAAVYERL